MRKKATKICIFFRLIYVYRFFMDINNLMFFRLFFSSSLDIEISCCYFKVLYYFIFCRAGFCEHYYLNIFIGLLKPSYLYYFCYFLIFLLIQL